MGYKGYKMGALKRKFGTGRASVEPGTFIQMSQKNITNQIKPTIPTEKVAIMGLV